MKHMGLFEGIGGFSLAARWAGWTTPVMVEWNPYCQAVLKKNFPDATIFSDIRNFDGRPYAGQIDIITGGFPCQPFSSAGKRAGTADDRYLWPEMLRVIREVGPQWVVGENVAGLLTMDGGRVLRGILADLENAGYRAEIYLIPALAVGAPHRRDRLWIVAHAANVQSGERYEPAMQRGRQGETKQVRVGDRDIGNAKSARAPQVFGIQERQSANAVGSSASNRPPADAGKPGLQRQQFAGTPGEGERPPRPTTQQDCNGWREHWHEVATRICGMAHGLPAGVDGIGDVPQATTKGKAHRLEALGNAIVPQVAYEIFKAINEAAQ